MNLPSDKITGIRVDYGIHETPFGTALLGVTERGICWLSFVGVGDEPRTEMEKMKDLSVRFVRTVFMLK